jgi:Rad3-related DNA helicase
LQGTLDAAAATGRGAARELLERFRALGNAVLLGTQSFWEGVDVRGRALSCVIIDKLPFAAPDDPLLQARLQALRDRGGNPFMEDQLPQAVISLKQGVGRLIRDVTDRGVLVLCDPRLTRQGLWQGLPQEPSAHPAGGRAGGRGGIHAAEAGIETDA